MSVRDAKFVDIPAIVELMAEAHARSRYAGYTTFDEIEAKQLLLRCIQRHRHKNYLGSLVLVSHRGEDVTGFMVGILDQVYPALKELKATDLLIYLRDGADPRDFPEMVTALIDWARSNPKVVQVLLGVTDAIIDWKRVVPIYERACMVECGGLFRIDFDRSDEKMAEAS